MQSTGLEEMESSDLELIAKYKETGDSTLVGELYERYSHLVLGTCLKYLKNEEEARDAVADIFISLIDKLISHNVANFKSWLYSVTSNHCRQILRKNKGIYHTDVNDENNSEKFMEKPDFEYLTNEQEELEARLHGCIESLKEEQQLCVKLFYFEKKRYKEIVTLTGFEMKKVKSYIQNGKANLSKCMGV